MTFDGFQHVGKGKKSFLELSNMLEALKNNILT